MMTGKDGQERWQLGTAVRTWEHGHQPRCWSGCARAPPSPHQRSQRCSPRLFLALTQRKRREQGEEEAVEVGRSPPPAPRGTGGNYPGGASAPRGASALTVSPGRCWQLSEWVRSPFSGCSPKPRWSASLGLCLQSTRSIFFSYVD